MLYECIAAPNTHPKFTELVMKSLWKVMRVIESWDDTLDYAAVLKEVNHFLAVSNKCVIEIVIFIAMS